VGEEDEGESLENLAHNESWPSTMKIFRPSNFLLRRFQFCPCSFGVGGEHNECCRHHALAHLSGCRRANLALSSLGRRSKSVAKVSAPVAL